MGRVAEDLSNDGSCFSIGGLRMKNPTKAAGLLAMDEPLTAAGSPKF
jgi:hypothetical protein